mmetsp:Transcript_11112/g.9837  ORF Transcript_11112/g.9837 Transcript_11112/m.9837 type:complete len:168 (+) Transcript_11112:243-746(+)
MKEKNSSMASAFPNQKCSTRKLIDKNSTDKSFNHPKSHFNTLPVSEDMDDIHKAKYHGKEFLHHYKIHLENKNLKDVSYSVLEYVINHSIEVLEKEIKTIASPQKSDIRKPSSIKTRTSIKNDDPHEENIMKKINPKPEERKTHNGSRRNCVKTKETNTISDFQTVI